MIVLNEIKYAEDVIANGKIDKKPSSTISLLAKYYKQHQKKSNKETFDEINIFMQNNYPFYNKIKWENSILGIIDKSDKYKLREIDSIEITEKELETIKSLNNERKERLLFTMLCIAKTFNKTSEINNGWLNTDINEIYKCARVSVKQANEKYLIVHEFIKLGLLECSNKNTNLNLRVAFIDNESPVVLDIITLEELGYEYMNYRNKARFCRCTVCDKLIKVKRNENRLYCTEHSNKNKIDYKMSTCVDCGKQIMITNLKNTKTCRCEECQHEETNKQVRENMKKYRDKSKCYNSNEKANSDFC